ncbi:hypothetical protein [Brevibacillus laterosporus]|uniref:hypothetical protein n=1 Tax=Brevibacillus laterosporus TaxID=1465 RepID=UPI0003B22527|nr:hypothetical protein [Brevibacillus laterosporus]ERM20047.1 hypothetical protein P615_09140 [Brevibacillus laterosporus PE36]
MIKSTTIPNQRAFGAIISDVNASFSYGDASSFYGDALSCDGNALCEQTRDAWPGDADASYLKSESDRHALNDGAFSSDGVQLGP